MSRSNFRKFVPTPEASKVHGETAREHAKKMLKRPVIKNIFADWQKMFSEPFKGISTNGNIIDDLFELRSERAATERIVIATNHLLDLLTPSQTNSLRSDVFSNEWRNWQNTEIYREESGLRLSEVSAPIRGTILKIIEISLSQKGYEKTRNVMRLNGFLGELVGGPLIFGEFTYLFNLYGEPSLSEPWGWQIFGHHLCLNCLILRDQMTITPTFMGGEPCNADEGPFNGLSIFEDEERRGLELMQSFSHEQKSKALLASSMVGGDLPEGRRVQHDGLHLGGAYCDNRIIPLEGLQGSDLSNSQKQDLLDLIAEYIGTLSKGPFDAKMNDVERFFDETHFCWIGGQKENEAFYYRIQSPVTLIEFDHHAGVFLNNDEPQDFHIHTLVRTPNGNDYGIDLIRQHYKNSPHHKHY